MMRSTAAAGATMVVAMTVLAVACSGGSKAPSAPTPSPTTAPGGGGSNPTTATVTIGADGRVSPATVTVAPGGRVTFVNNHTQNHDMSSDPHPDHTDCPEVNEVGFLTSGQSRATGNLNTSRTCGFHDHNQPSNSALSGRIVIQ